MTAAISASESDFPNASLNDIFCEAAPLCPAAPLAFFAAFFSERFADFSKLLRSSGAENDFNFWANFSPPRVFECPDGCAARALPDERTAPERPAAPDLSDGCAAPARPATRSDCAPAPSDCARTVNFPPRESAAPPAKSAACSARAKRRLRRFFICFDIISARFAAA